MFTVLVTMDVQPQHVAEFEGLIAENARLSVQREDGCLVFDVIRPDEHPDRFFLYEVYVDEAAFEQVHLTAEHYLAFSAASTPLLVPGGKSRVLGRRIVEGSHVER